MTFTISGTQVYIATALLCAFLAGYGVATYNNAREHALCEMLVRRVNESTGQQ